MGLLDKIKDLFLEEEPEETELELEEENRNIYEEPKDILPKVMRDTIKKEEEDVVKFEELKPTMEEVKKVEEPIPQRKFSFPVEFEEEVVTTSRVVNRNVLTTPKEPPKKVTELYSKKEEVKEKPKFKPTPVISPVYGVLDKNYKKEEVVEKTEESSAMKRPSKKVDFETVRKKAFGNLSDDIKDNLMCENCELYKEVKRISTLSSDDLLYDMMVDDVKPEEPLTIENAYNNYEDFGVAYEPQKEDVSKVENKTIINNTTEVQVSEKIEIEDKEFETSPVSEEEVELKIPSRQEKKKETKVDDDFFELIDSMYKERIDG